MQIELHLPHSIVNGKSVVVAITGDCPGCQLSDLDLSPAAFNDIASLSLGRIDVTWILNEPIPS